MKQRDVQVGQYYYETMTGTIVFVIEKVGESFVSYVRHKLEDGKPVERTGTIPCFSLDVVFTNYHIARKRSIKVCELEYIGQLGSEPYFHIFTCHTHPHNFFSRKREITECDKADERDTAPDATRPRCKVCGTTDHHTDESGDIVENPPRR